jgi:hypothetical protein
MHLKTYILRYTAIRHLPHVYILKLPVKKANSEDYHLLGSKDI